MGEHDKERDALELMAQLALIAQMIQYSMDEYSMLEQDEYSGVYVPKSTHPLTDQQIADNNSKEIWDADMDVTEAQMYLCKFRK